MGSLNFIFVEAGHKTYSMLDGVLKQVVVRGLKSLSAEFCFISHGNLGEDRVKSTS